MITPEEFEDHAKAVFDGIPATYRQRVDGPFVELEPMPSEHVPGSFVLGECHHHPDWTGESPLHSSVILYYGSFAALEQGDPSFDVVDEIRETVLHEVQHHLEDAAGVDRLADLDWAEDQNDRRVQDLPHDDLFWRAGTPLDDGMFRVGDDLFVEVEMRESEWQRARTDGVELTVGGAFVRLAPDEFDNDGRARAVFDWDWSAAPHDLRETSGHGHGHGHGHGADDDCAHDGWGDLVIIARRRRSLLPALLGKRDVSR